MAFSRAAGMPSRERGLSSNMGPPSVFWTKQLQEFPECIVKLVHYALLERNDRVVGDCDAFRANFRAALGDVAIAHALGLLEFRQPVFGVQRVHLQCRGVNQKTRSDER